VNGTETGPETMPLRFNHPLFCGWDGMFGLKAGILRLP
jgi:hypothetical protein